MKKILFVTSLSGKTVNAFMLSSIMAAKEIGYEFHLAANFENADMQTYNEQAKKFGFIIHHIPFIKNPLSLKNRKAKKELTLLMNDIRFDIVHCNTPIGGLLGRMVAKKLNYKNVIYMAHGFHFYKGSPLMNWMLYYPVEKCLGKYTNTLVTINKEDYELAKNKKMCSNIIFTHGVGIDTKRFSSNQQKDELKKYFNLPHNKKIVLAIGEINKNKNQITLLKSIRLIDNQNIHFVFCGDGKLKTKLYKYAKKYNINDKITFYNHIDYSDIDKLYGAADIFWFASLREGLPSVVIEAMSSSLPCIVSNIRGNSDLIENNRGGYLVSPKNYKDFARRVSELASNEIEMKSFGIFNHEKAKEYDIANSIKEISNIYLSYRND